MSGGTDLPPDDSSIPDDSLVYRRISPEHVVVDDQNPGGRPSSQAFQDHRESGAMSVSLGVDLGISGSDPMTLLEGWEEHGLVSLPVSNLREHGLGIVRDPQSDDPAHALVWGRKKGAVGTKLAKSAVWIKRPN